MRRADLISRYTRNYSFFPRCIFTWCRRDRHPISYFGLMVLWFFYPFSQSALLKGDVLREHYPIAVKIGSPEREGIWRYFAWRLEWLASSPAVAWPVRSALLSPHSHILYLHVCMSQEGPIFSSSYSLSIFFFSSSSCVGRDHRV